MLLLFVRVLIGDLGLRSDSVLLSLLSGIARVMCSCSLILFFVLVLWYVLFVNCSCSCSLLFVLVTWS